MNASPALQQSLADRLHRVARLSDRDAGAACLAACGLNVGETRCLVAIGTLESLSINDVAHRSNQDKGQASRSVESLVDLGLVVRKDRADDGRSVELSLTRKGAGLRTKAMRLMAERDAAFFSALSATERRTLGALLDRVARSLADA